MTGSKMVSFRKGLLLRALLLLVFGLVLMFRPVQFMLYVTIAIGVFIAFDGVTALMKSRGGVSVIYGLLALLCGLGCIFMPLWMNEIWVILLGIWMIFGAVDCFDLVRRGAVGSKTWGIVYGVVSLLAGILCVAAPLAGLAAIMMTLGIMLAVCSVMLLAGIVFIK